MICKIDAIGGRWIMDQALKECMLLAIPTIRDSIGRSIIWNSTIYSNPNIDMNIETLKVADDLSDAILLHQEYLKTHKSKELKVMLGIMLVIDEYNNKVKLLGH